ETAAAERPDAARPAAPGAAAPVAPPAPGAAAAAAQQQRDDDENDDRRNRESLAAALGPRLARHVGQRDAALLGDAGDDAGRAREQPGAELAVPERGHDDGADRLAGEAVGDELLEVVAGFDPDRAVVDRGDDEDAVVPAALADPLAAILEELDRVLL